MAFRIADRPHAVTVAFGLLAAAISILVWRESHVSRKVSVATSRAIVRVTGGKVTGQGRRVYASSAESVG
jgi:hypothetical protein